MIIVIFAYKLFRGSDGKLLKISTILAKKDREKEGRVKRRKGGRGKGGGQEGWRKGGKEGGVEPSRQKLQV